MRQKPLFSDGQFLQVQCHKAKLYSTEGNKRHFLETEYSREENTPQQNDERRNENEGKKEGCGGWGNKKIQEYNPRATVCNYSDTS